MQQIHHISSIIVNLSTTSRMQKKAKLQSVYSKQGIKMGKKMAWLLKKHKNVVNNFMNQAVNYIIVF